MGTAHQAPCGFVQTVRICLESDTLPTYSQSLESGLLDVVVVMAPNVLSEVLDWL